MARFRRTLEVGDLPAPVAWLDTHAGTVVSILQAPVEYGPEMRPLVSPGQVCVHDPITLRPNVLARPRGRIQRARISRTHPRRMTVCSWPEESREPSVVDLWDLAEGTRTTRTFPREVWDAVWWRDRVVVGVSGRRVAGGRSGLQPLLISDGTDAAAERLSIAPDGTAIAVSYAESPHVRVYRTRDGALLGEASMPGQRPIAWLDASRLLIGGDTLSLWELDV